MRLQFFFFFLWNTKEDILKNVNSILFHTMKVNRVWCCFGPHWLWDKKSWNMKKK